MSEKETSMKNLNGMKTLDIRMQMSQDDLTTACFEVYDCVGDDSGWNGEGVGPKKLAAFLRNNPQIEKIEVRINSNGGDVFAGVAVANVLQSVDKPVHVVVDGIAASAASAIAMAGDTVTMPESSMLMIHNAYTWTCGNAKELRKEADDLDKVMQSVKLLYLGKAKGKVTAEKLDELLDEGTYLSAKEAYMLGLCDEVVDKDGNIQEFDEEPAQSEDETPDDEKEKSPDPEGSTADQIEAKTEWFFW